MTQDEKRIAIAEACGWECDSLGNWAHPSDGYERMSCDAESILPDYFNDLNAMHEAEKVLTNEQRDIFDYKLSNQVALDWLDESEPFVWHATAAQRAEAFGLTLKLWEPDSKS